MATSNPVANRGTPAQTQISRYTHDKIVKYVENIYTTLRGNWNLRSKMLEVDRIYQREVDTTEEQRRAQVHNKMGDVKKMQNVVAPVVQPQVEATLSYLVETFLSSYPIFPVVSKPELSELAKQIDTTMGESAIQFQYARHLAMALRDGLKYNIMAVEVEWKDKKIYAVTNDPAKSIKNGVPVETLFSGNEIKRLDMYNTMLDPTVPPAEVHSRGDFAGYTELITRMEMKQRLLELDSTQTMNATEAFESGGSAYTLSGDGTASYYIPPVNPAALRDDKFVPQNWLVWAGQETENKIKYSDMYEWSVLYVRIIPREFAMTRVSNNGVPQIFKIIVINRKVCVYLERKANAHNYLPIIVGQPIEDGLGYQTKSFADNSTPYQFLSSALYNSAVQSQRRKVYDRIFYDPSRITKGDIDRTDVVARIPVKTEAYGKPISEAFAQVPYRDEGVPQILAMAREVQEMADIGSGQNRVQRGQFQKGNKTRQEFDTVMDKSDARPRMMAVLLETGWFQPIKHVCKMNILQYQPPVELYNRQLQEPVKVTPSELRKVAWEFQIADGVLPVSRLINYETFGQVMQFAQANPMMAVEYDLVGMFFYTLKLQGATWVDSFKRDPAMANQLRMQANGTNPTPGQLPAPNGGANPTLGA